MLKNYQNLDDNSVLCLMSPTASGKTQLAFKLYDTNRFDIISVDSALIYQDMNIGTAKPTAYELIRYPHALVNIKTPIQSYSVAQFITDVKTHIDNAHHRNKIPLLVGGSMMYYMALFEGISAVPQTNPNIRQQVKHWQSQKGNSYLMDYLQKYDKAISQKLTVYDSQRLARAVEVHLQTGIAMSVYQDTPKTALANNAHQHWQGICVMPNRTQLHHNIQQRLDMMWQADFVEEVIAIINKYPVTYDMPSMRCVGYRQVVEYLLATCHPKIANSFLVKDFNLPQNQPLLANFVQNFSNFDNNACQVMKNRALYATRQLAKRQYTWLRRLALSGLSTNPNTNFSMYCYDSIQQVEQALFG